MPDARRAPDPSAPSTLGRYHILDEVGRDRVYVTHLARLEGPSGFQKWAIVRRVRPEVAEVPGFRDAFYDAARASGRIDHPHVVATHDVGEEDGMLWTALEYVQGELVEDILERTQRAHATVAWSIACKIVSDAALGIDGIHSARDDSGKRLLHGHLAPRNLVVGYSGKTKVLDPCTPIVPTDVEASITVSDDQSAVLPYMAPEQVWGEKVDARSDVFSLGVVLWELCAGRRLFRGRNEDETRALLEAVSVPELRHRVKGIPGAVDAILRRAIAREPKKRFDTARELARTLQEVLVSQGIPLDEEEVTRYMGRVFADRLEEREKLLRQASDVTEVFRRGDFKLKPKTSAAPPPRASRPPMDAPPPARRVGASNPPPPIPPPPRRPASIAPPVPPPAADTVRDLGAEAAARGEEGVSSTSDEQPTMVMSESSLGLKPAVESDSDDGELATRVQPQGMPSFMPMRDAPSVEVAPELLAPPPPPMPLPHDLPPLPMPYTSMPPPGYMPMAAPPNLAATVLVRPRPKSTRTFELVAIAVGLVAMCLVLAHVLAPFFHPPGTDDTRPSATPLQTASAPLALPVPTSAAPAPAPSMIAPTASTDQNAALPVAPSSTKASTAPTPRPTPIAMPTPPPPSPAPTHHRVPTTSDDNTTTPAPSPVVPSGGSKGLLTVICVPACDQVLDGSSSLGSSPIYKVSVRAGAHKLTLRTSDPPVEKNMETSVKADDVTVVKVQMAPQ